MREEICPQCQGNGYVEYTGGPGYYSSSFGNYLPGETVERCFFCGGSGIVEVEDEHTRTAEEDRAA